MISVAHSSLQDIFSDKTRSHYLRPAALYAILWSRVLRLLLYHSHEYFVFCLGFRILLLFFFFIDLAGASDDVASAVSISGHASQVQ